MENDLLAAGLSAPQASVYLYLLDHTDTTPPTLANALKLSRTNAYKILDSLVEIGLASKADVRKKLAYRAGDPAALASLVAIERNKLIAMEQSVKAVTETLRRRYTKNIAKTLVLSEQSAEALVLAYETQAQRQAPIYFIKTRADIPFLGYETMDRLRKLSVQYDVQRFGIVPDGPEAPANPAIDARTNLRRTWISAEEYTAPVEWSLSGDELLITIFEGHGRLVKIKDATVAEAFLAIWKLLDSRIRSGSDYQQGPSQARREQ